jgi:L-lactate dehydrogenase complex protein LldG
MNSREAILGRIREALKFSAPVSGVPEAAQPPPEPTAFRQWLPAVGPTWDDQCQLFAQNAAMLKAAFKVVPSMDAAAEEIRLLIKNGQWKKIATHASPLTDAVCQNLGVEILRTDRPYDTMDLEKCEGSVTVCEALVAQTGSVLITSRGCGGRAISI